MKTAKRISATLVTLTLVLVFTLTTSTTVAATNSLEPNSLAYVTADTFLNLRDKPQGEIIGQIPNGDVVTIKSKIDRNGYYAILVNRTNETGYAYGEYLSPYYYINNDQNDKVDVDYTVPTIDGLTENATLVVTCETRLNFREGPSLNSRRISYLYPGDYLLIMSTEITNNYIYVKNITTNRTGYVSIDYVKVVTTNTTDYECCPYCKNCICCQSQQW